MGALFTVVGAGVVAIATFVALPYTIVDLVTKYKEDNKNDNTENGSADSN